MLTPALVCLLPLFFVSVMMVIDLLLSSEMPGSSSLIAFLGLVLGVVIRKESNRSLRIRAIWSLSYFGQVSRSIGGVIFHINGLFCML